MCLVPICIAFERRGDDCLLSSSYKYSLEEKLEFYPVTRRAFERALEIYNAEN